MLDKIRDIIGEKRGLALAIREDGLVGFYKIWVDYKGDVNGTVCDFHKESSIKVEGDYERTYDNVGEILLEASIFKFYNELNKDEVLELLKDKEINNLDKKQLYKGYTDFVYSNKEYELFVY